MGKRLKDNITSRYMEAANSLASKKARRKIIAYVESYDDIFFWRTVLSQFENEQRYFEVMLPSHKVLTRGKKSVLMNFIGDKVGPDMIACVDADYDYLLQGVTATSRYILESPYVFHTYVYAIENFQCYAESLHNVAVMVTLNDHAIFDFTGFMHSYSEICYPLFVWSILLYRKGDYPQFSLTDYAKAVELGGFNYQSPQSCLEHLRNKVTRKIHWLQQRFPDAKSDYLKLKDEMTQLGVVPRDTYLYMQGHHLFDAIVVPIMSKVCNRLRLERENEISRTAIHRTQMHNELSCYENSLADIRMMLKKNMGYLQCSQFRRLQDDVARYLDGGDCKAETDEDNR